MRGTGAALERMIAAIGVVFMEMQHKHPATGLAQHMFDRLAIGLSECSRRRKHAQRVGHDHHRRSQTPQLVLRVGSHRTCEYAQTKRFGRI
jgi:hypothetical protein